MTIKPDTERLLREFLEGGWQRAMAALNLRVDGLVDDVHANDASLNLRVDELVGNITQHDADDRERHAELLGDQKHNVARINSLEGRADALEDRNEQTGRHQLVKLEGELANRHVTMRYWVTTAIGILFGLFGIANMIVSALRK